MTKMYNIVDMQGNYYKIGAKGNLVAAKNSDMQICSPCAKPMIGSAAERKPDTIQR